MLATIKGERCSSLIFSPNLIKMKNVIIVKSGNNNYYLYNRTKTLLLSIHPLIAHYHTGQIASVEDALTNKEWVKEYGKKSIKEVFDLYRFLHSQEIIREKPFEYHERSITAREVEHQMQNIRSVVFEITDQCNLQCYYCGFGELYDNKGIRKSGAIPFSYIQDTFTFLKQCGSFTSSIPRTFHVGFYGGEPLLEFDLIKKTLSYLHEFSKDNCSNIRFTFGLTTNGILLKNSIADFLVRHDFLLTISLDGNKKNHAYRVFPNGSNSFDIVHKNVVELKEKHPEYYKRRVNFNAVLHDKNPQEDLIPFFGALEKNPGIMELSKSDIAAGKESEFKRLLPTQQITIKNPAYFKPLFMDHNKTHVYSDYLDLLSPRKDPSGYTKHTCQTGTCFPFSRKLYIKNNGFIYPCERIGYSYHFAELTEKGLRFDPEAIAKRYNEYFSMYLPFCKHCYNNLSCPHCLFHSSEDITKGITSCMDFLSHNAFTNYLTYLVTAFENYENTQSYADFVNHAIIH